MRIFNVEPEIGDRDGFKPEVDIFKRAPIGEGLTHLVTSVDQPLVIAIDADWGSGKTVFLKMWAGELRNLGVPVIYFDAFANDYLDDAFLALAGEVIRLAKAEKDISSSKVKRFTEKAVGAGKILMRSAGKTAVKAATLGLLDNSEIDGIAKKISDDIADQSSELADKYLEQILTSADKRKTTLEGFRAALSELPSLMRKPAESKNKEDKEYPLVFIIDELDRCTPPFALHILERIKHVFSAPNIHFVLGVHLDQLCNNVKAQYGSEIDARTYLDKFIHVNVPLVDTSRYENESVSSKYIEFLSEKIRQPGQERLVGLLGDFLLDYSNRTGLTLRGLQRVYTTIALAVAAHDKRTPFIAPLVAGLAILKLQHPELYRKAKKGKLRYDEVVEIFRFNDAVNKERQDYMEWASEFWRIAIDENAPPKLLSEFGRGWGHFPSTREQLLPMIANNLIDRFKP